MFLRLTATTVAIFAASFVLAAQDRRPAPTTAEGRRLALVIGNDAYQGAPLVNGRNDARAMAAALRRLAFTVTVVEDATRVQLTSALLAFGQQVEVGDLALVFYAGHGVQVDGVNYLIPVDFTGRSGNEVRLNAVASEEVARSLQRARVGVLVLDACRDNPYSSQRSGARGLANQEAQGLLVAFATGAGQTAGDSPDAGNGVFTSELLRVLGQPGIGLRETFFEVQRRVQVRTGGRQFPAVYSQLTADVVLVPGPRAALQADTPASPAPPRAAAPPTESPWTAPSPFRYRNLLVEVDGVDVHSGGLQTTVRFTSDDPTQGIALAHRAQNSDGIADFWKFFPSPLGRVVDGAGAAFSLSQACRLGCAREVSDWTVLRSGEAVTHALGFEGRGTPTPPFAVSLDLWVVTRARGTDRQERHAVSVVFRGVAPGGRR